VGLKWLEFVCDLWYRGAPKPRKQQQRWWITGHNDASLCGTNCGPGPQSVILAIVNYHRRRISWLHKLASLIEWKFHQLFIGPWAHTRLNPYIKITPCIFSGQMSHLIGFSHRPLFAFRPGRSNNLLNESPRREFSPLPSSESIIEDTYLRPKVIPFPGSPTGHK